MKYRWIEYFILSAGGILLFAALVRFLIAMDGAQVLSLPDPALTIPLRYALIIIGAIELIVSFVCLLGKNTNLQMCCLIWLSTNFVVFSFLAICLHIQVQGTCVGSLTDPLGLYRGAIGPIMFIFPYGFILACYAAGLFFWFSKEARATRTAENQRLADRRDAAAGLLKIPCPSCGGRIKFDVQDLGQQRPCPHCATAVTLQKTMLKMTCVLCKGNVEFPSHAVGQKILCPHCAKRITLLQPA